MTPTTSTQKVRRTALGGKRAQGRNLQLLKRVHRPDPTRIHVEANDPTLTSSAGLVGWACFLRRAGVDEHLTRLFRRLKGGPQMVYPVPAQLRLLMDLAVLGHDRIFDLEALAVDPLVEFLAGGFVPSIDTLYDDLRRFDDKALRDLDAMVSEHGLAPLRSLKPKTIHLDIDTTVEVVFGTQIEGAVPGPNPRYKGRPSYHPILATIAETGTLAGVELRPGNTAFGDDDVTIVKRWVQRVRLAVGPHCVIVVRIDAAGDCTALLKALQELGVHYVIKARMDARVASAIQAHRDWTSVDHDADGRAIRQVAEIDVQRVVWKGAGIAPRVLAAREWDRESGGTKALWPALDWSAWAVLTNAAGDDVDTLIREYNGRAEVEPMIADLKDAWGIGKIPTNDFSANHAMLLLKALTFNLLARYVAAKCPAARHWRTPWVRHAVMRVAGRLVRSGRSRTLRVPPHARYLN